MEQLKSGQQWSSWYKVKSLLIIMISDVICFEMPKLTIIIHCTTNSCEFVGWTTVRAFSYCSWGHSLPPASVTENYPLTVLIPARSFFSGHFLKTAQQQSANFEVDSIPFSGERSDSRSLLKRHSHPLRQTLINLCVQVWISQLNLWHAAYLHTASTSAPHLQTKTA